MNNLKPALTSLLLLGSFVTAFYAGEFFAGRLYAHQQFAAAPMSVQNVGERIGSVVHDVVRNIRAKHPGSQLTHAHVLAVMCQELPSLRMDEINSEGRAEGMTQVITKTYKGLVSGQGASGSCSYIAGLENGECANPDSRVTNTRCSIEAGACLFDYELTRCNGNVSCAYNAYNTGSPNKRANGANDFITGYQNLIRGTVCDKASNNTGVWAAIMQTVSKLTDGTFKTEDAIHIAVSALNLRGMIPEAVFSSSNGITGSQGFWENNPIGNLLGFSSSPGESSSGDSSSVGSSVQKGPISSSYGNTSGNTSSSQSSQSSPSSPFSAFNTSGGSGGSSGGSFNGTSNNESGSLSDNFRTNDGEDSATAGISATSPQTTATLSIDDLAPTLLCLPNPINAGEAAILMWACRDSSDSSALTADDTSNPVDTINDTIGTARVTPNGDTTYTLTCDKGTQSSCTVEVANPALAILTTPSSATRGQTVTISWKTKDTNACIVTSSDPNHQNFSRQGVEGDAVSPTLTRNTTFVLTCETVTGTLEERGVSVGVN
jgi:hypothetical protein